MNRALEPFDLTPVIRAKEAQHFIFNHDVVLGLAGPAFMSRYENDYASVATHR